jgi:hypothetical protein
VNWLTESAALATSVPACGPTLAEALPPARNAKVAAASARAVSLLLVVMIVSCSPDEERGSLFDGQEPSVAPPDPNVLAVTRMRIRADQVGVSCSRTG